MSEAPTQLEAQVRLSKLLGLGFACSLVWAAGVGSLIALCIGIRARRIIKQSGGELAGIRLAWWCIIAGAFGIVTITPYVVWLVIKAKQ